MKMIEVESSQISAIGYDAGTQTLAVQFKKKTGPGSTYHYANVTETQWKEFQAAESIGKWFGTHIKGHEDDHPFTKQEPK